MTEQVTLYTVRTRGGVVTLHAIRAEIREGDYWLNPEDAGLVGYVGYAAPIHVSAVDLARASLFQSAQHAAHSYAQRKQSEIWNLEEQLLQARQELGAALELVEDAVRKAGPDLAGVFSEKSGGDHV